jgi:NAD(P)-dependent dehydrogenase (short-subunit alcohol dehydrogenase family)
MTLSDAALDVHVPARAPGPGGRMIRSVSSVGPTNLAGRTVLITGGAGATGLATAHELHRRGAIVVIGTRSRERYGAAAALLGGERVLPFIADLTDVDGVRRELEDLRDRGLRVSDVIHSAAGGLEPILRHLMRRLVRLRRLSGADMGAALETFRAEMSALVEGSRSFAIRVNLDGPCALFEQLADVLPPGGALIYYTSLWSSLYGSLDVPCFYSAIAASKHAFEAWLDARSGLWTTRGLSLAVVSGHVIKDSPLGDVIDRYLVPLLPANRQEVARSFFITTSDMVLSAIQVVADAARDGRGRFVRVFVPGHGQAIGQLDPSAPALSDPFPL